MTDVRIKIAQLLFGEDNFGMPDGDYSEYHLKLADKVLSLTAAPSSEPGEVERLKADCEHWARDYDERGKVLLSEKTLRQAAEATVERLTTVAAEVYDLRAADSIWKQTVERLTRDNELLRAQMHGMQDGSLVRDLGAQVDRLTGELAEARAEAANRQELADGATRFANREHARAEGLQAQVERLAEWPDPPAPPLPTKEASGG